MADFKIGNTTPSSGKLKVGNVEVKKLYNGATLIWQNAFVFTTRAQLDTAINLWISDNAAALATYGEINTWRFEANTSLANFSSLFLNKDTFNSDISNWDVSNVTDMRSMFEDASSFNQSLNSWNTGSVTKTGFMFRDATSFNGDISSWDVSNVTDMQDMFFRASVFNQNLGSWDVSNVTDMGNMIYLTAINTTNYDALLTGWNALTLQSNVQFGAIGVEYCSTAAQNARTNIINTYNWTISDEGQAVGCP